MRNLKTALLVAAALFCVQALHQAMAQSSNSKTYIRADFGSSAAKIGIHDSDFDVDHVINGANGVPGTLNDKIGTGWFLGVGAGSQILRNFRGELVYTYRKGYHLDQSDEGVPVKNFKANISSHSAMANLFADFPTGSPTIVPFIGVGIGWSQNSLSKFSESIAIAAHAQEASFPGGSSDNLAWQLMLGVGFLIPGGATMEIFYRYFNGGDIRTDAGNIVLDGNVIGTYSGAEGALHAHEVTLAFRIPVSL